MEYSSELVDEVCFREGIIKDQLILHSDNGGAMKGAMMLVTLQRLGVIPSFSRPRVSDDNPYSESLFKTLKYCPKYPSKPFSSIEGAMKWVSEFVDWYNNHHLHSGIKFVTPASKHVFDLPQEYLNKQFIKRGDGLKPCPFCLSLHSFLKLEWCQYCNDLNLFVLRPIDNSIALYNDLSQIWRFFND